jgi:hypothetical protein
MTLERKKRRKSSKPLWEREADRLKAKEDLYVVEEILNKRYDEESQGYIYYVKWEGFPKSENTWEPEETLLQDVPEMVVDYND